MIKSKSKLTSLIIVIIGFLYVVGCSFHSKTIQSIDDIPVNEKIQTNFFGATFSDKKDSVIAKFESADLEPQKMGKSSELMKFICKKADHVTFAHMEWDYVDVLFRNDKFCRIRFINTYETKDSAMVECYRILKKVSAKYQLKDLNVDDVPKCSAGATGKDVNDYVVAVFCDSVLSKKRYATKLVYGSMKIIKEADEEL